MACSFGLMMSQHSSELRVPDDGDREPWNMELGKKPGDQGFQICDVALPGARPPGSRCKREAGRAKRRATILNQEFPPPDRCHRGKYIRSQVYSRCRTMRIFMR